MKARTLTKTSMKTAAAVTLGGAVLLLASCFYMPGVSGRPAKAGLSINRAELPSNISSFALIVGGPGMQTIAATYPLGTTSATLSVPSGVARTFTFLANTESVTFQDSVTVDLQPDETKEIALTPKLFATQIIVPDFSNRRLVQISDMQGTGWTTLEDQAAGLNPYDVDFDSQGRIYISDTSRGILWVDGISGTPAPLAGVVSTYVQSIAMDRTSGYLYYIGGGGTLYRIQPGVGSEEYVTSFEVAGGVAVDSDGFVYVVSYYPEEVVKIDPNGVQGATVVDRSTYTFDYPWDILVNGDDVYVSDQGDGKIVRLNKNLSFVDSFSGPASDSFQGPEQFVAILNKPITVIDEGVGDRLVSFGDMTGAGWTTYGSTGYSGSGPGFFTFYGGSG